MANVSLSLTPSATEAARTELKSYNVTIPMGSLSIGVDNIHHDVFLSPKFVQAARDYLFELIRQNTKATYFPGIELRANRGPDNAGFRRLLIDLLQSSLTQAKYHKNIEMDLLFRLALLKFLIAETGQPIRQFDPGRERVGSPARRTFRTQPAGARDQGAVVGVAIGAARGDPRGGAAGGAHHRGCGRARDLQSAAGAVWR